MIRQGAGIYLTSLNFRRLTNMSIDSSLFHRAATCVHVRACVRAGGPGRDGPEEGQLEKNTRRKLSKGQAADFR